MKKDVVMPLNTVNHYTRLPEGQSVKLFQRFLTKNSKHSEISIKHYFLAANSLKDAFLMACFCFGQLKFLDALSSLPIQIETINYLRTQMSQFCWEKSSPLITFQENSKKIGKIYPYYWQNVLSKLNVKDCEEQFKKVKDNHLLFGVKIRRWKEFEEPQVYYRQLQRLYEKTELTRINGTHYLLFAETKSGSCNFGILQETIQIDSIQNYPEPIQSNEQMVNKDCKININTFDVKKKEFQEDEKNAEYEQKFKIPNTQFEYKNMERRQNMDNQHKLKTQSTLQSKSAVRVSENDGQNEFKPLPKQVHAPYSTHQVSYVLTNNKAQPKPLLNYQTNLNYNIKSTSPEINNEYKNTHEVKKFQTPPQYFGQIQQKGNKPQIISKSNHQSEIILQTTEVKINCWQNCSCPIM